MASSWGTSWGSSWGGSWGAVTEGAITGVLFVDPDTFGASVVGRGAVNVTGTLYTNPDTFGANTISASYSIAGAKYTDPDTFGAATIGRGTVSIVGTLYVNPDTFGTSVVSIGAFNISAQIFIDPDSFGAASVYTPTIEYISPGQERCMRCGFVKNRSETRREWTGLIVCRSTCWDPRHPQMSLRGVPDDQTVPWTSPEPTPVFIEPSSISGDDL